MVNKNHSHFFISEDSSLTQTRTQCFGVVDGTTFNLTSAFNLVSPKMAYMICKGTVLIVPQGSIQSNVVNLILRPYDQPFLGLKIKYFVYRGLQRSDFFTSGTAPTIISASGASDFISTIRTTFTNFYAGEAIPEFKAEYIGFNNYPESTLLSDIFFKNSIVTDENTPSEIESGSYELPLIGMGKSLGHFRAGECGIDVVLDYGDFENEHDESLFRFDIAYAKKAKAAIDLSNTNDHYQKKIKREQIFQFLDIAAYYGAHVDSGIVKTVGEKHTGTSIYNAFLLPFYSKNSVYFYIQSNRGRSYNFYENYYINDTKTVSFKHGISESQLIESNYATLGWPIWIDEQMQSHNNIENSLFLQFPLTEGNNNGLHVQVGKLLSSTKGQIITQEDLIAFAAEGELRSAYSKSVVLLFPNILRNGSKANIASFCMLLYQGKSYSYQSDDDTEEVQSVGYLDDIFGLLDATSVFKSATIVQTKTLALHRPRLLNYYFDTKKKGTAIVQTVINHRLFDDETLGAYVTYIGEVIDAVFNATEDPSLIPDTGTQASSIAPATTGAFFQKNQHSYFDISYFTDIENIPGLMLNSIDGSPVQRISIGIHKEENDRILSALLASQLQNAQLILMDANALDQYFISPEHVRYKKYRLGLLGEIHTSGVLTTYPIDDIQIYTLDNYTYFSIRYALGMKNSSQDASSKNNYNYLRN